MEVFHYTCDLTSIARNVPNVAANYIVIHGGPILPCNNQNNATDTWYNCIEIILLNVYYEKLSWFKFEFDHPEGGAGMPCFLRWTVNFWPNFYLVKRTKFYISDYS